MPDLILLKEKTKCNGSEDPRSSFW